MQLINDLRTSRRLRIGLALIVAILWFYALLDGRDRNASAREQYALVAAQLPRLNDQQKQTQWLSRAKEGAQALARAEQGLWHNSSPGLAQAELQDWLSQQLTQSKAANFNVKVAESDAGAGPEQKSDQVDAAVSDVKRVRAKMEFNTDPKILDRFLAALAAADHLVTVDSMQVRQPRTEIAVSAWFLLQSAADIKRIAPSVQK